MTIESLSPVQRRIVDDLRVKVCLNNLDDAPLLLRETEIARDYDMSRTPVRQCLQYLSHCLMVETHTGYGTVPTPLLPENRDSDMRAYGAVAHACALFTSGMKVPADSVVELSSARTWLDLEEVRTEETFVSVNSRLVRSMASAVPNRLLRHAYVVAHWQAIRWRVLDVRENAELHWGKLEAGLDAAIAAARTRSMDALFGFASAIIDHHKTENRSRPLRL